MDVKHASKAVATVDRSVIDRRFSDRQKPTVRKALTVATHFAGLVIRLSIWVALGQRLKAVFDDVLSYASECLSPEPNAVIEQDWFQLPKLTFIERP